MIAESQAAGMTETNTYWALYLKKLNSSQCGNEKLSECKRFEAQAELYEFSELSKSFSHEFLRKADIGKVHIESRCTEKKHASQREPFLERPSLIEIILRGLRDD